VHGTTPVLAVLSLMQFAMQHSLTEWCQIGVRGNHVVS
jgi:hypothetical protein